MVTRSSARPESLTEPWPRVPKTHCATLLTAENRRTGHFFMWSLSWSVRNHNLPYPHKNMAHWGLWQGSNGYSFATLISAVIPKADPTIIETNAIYWHLLRPVAYCMFLPWTSRAPRHPCLSMCTLDPSTSFLCALLSRMQNWRSGTFKVSSRS